MNDVKPLVSILVPNYNYGKYLRQCFDSILEQTYENYEVIFRDNHSTDNSFDIAMEYYHKFTDRGIYFSIHRNRVNLGSDKNSAQCQADARGEYTYTLASDDAIAPTFIEKCVDILENNRNVSMVITERMEMDDDGNLYPCVPFYNKSCIIDGDAQAGVFMMSGIAIPGQRMCRLSAVSQTRDFARLWNVAGDWYINFRLSMVGDIAYIKEPLMYYRVHRGNETNLSELKGLGSFEHYQLLNAFVEIAKQYNRKEPVRRFGEAVKKLGGMCLRYSFKMIQNNEMEAAQRYLELAKFYDLTISNTESYHELDKILASRENENFNLLVEQYKSKFCVERKVSYDPPANHIDLLI